MANEPSRNYPTLRTINCRAFFNQLWSFFLFHFSYILFIFIFIFSFKKKKQRAHVEENDVIQKREDEETHSTKGLLNGGPLLQTTILIIHARGKYT